MLFNLLLATIFFIVYFIYFLFLFFFFQAEDGIRDLTVTGVQTCALPIYLEDPQVYQLIGSGRTAGVFQFESPLATDCLRSMRCDRFDDLVATNALLRPEIGRASCRERV